jgi:hypothetical protein
MGVASVLRTDSRMSHPNSRSESGRYIQRFWPRAAALAAWILRSFDASSEECRGLAVSGRDCREKGV